MSEGLDVLISAMNQRSKREQMLALAVESLLAKADELDNVLDVLSTKMHHLEQQIVKLEKQKRNRKHPHE